MFISELSPNKQKEAEEFIRNKQIELRREFEQEMLKNFTKDKDNLLRYGKTHFINLEKMKDPENTYVLPMFIKPGRTHFMLRTPEDSVIK